MEAVFLTTLLQLFHHLGHLLLHQLCSERYIEQLVSQIKEAARKQYFLPPCCSSSIISGSTGAALTGASFTGAVLNGATLNAQYLELTKQLKRIT